VGVYYRASDLFLINSRQESYPRSIMEALLFGLPVISTAVFGSREQIQHGVNGLLYDIDNESAWLACVARLARDTALRARMAQDAARSFWMLTTHAEMLNEYLAMISPRLSANPVRPAPTEADEPVATAG